MYDDGRLLDALPDLTDEILCNLTTLWLIKPTWLAVRTMDRVPRGNDLPAALEGSAPELETSATASGSAASSHGEGGRAPRVPCDATEEPQSKKPRNDPN